MMGDLVAELQGLGYELSLDGASLRFRYSQAGEPPEQAAILLERVREHKGETLRYLRLLRTPLSQTAKPLLIGSAILKDRFHLVADEDQAQKVEAGGGVCYLPGEIEVLLTNSNGMDEEGLKAYLNKIHAVKKTFPGARVGTLRG